MAALHPAGLQGRELAKKQAFQVVKLLTVQGLLDEVDLAPLLAEVIFAAHGLQEDSSENLERELEDQIEEADDLLVNSTALHLAVHYGLDNVVMVLLPQAGAALHYAAGPRRRTLTPLHTACDVGSRIMAKLLLQYGARAN